MEIRCVKSFLKIECDGYYRNEYLKYIVGNHILGEKAFYVVTSFQDNEEFAISILDSKQKTILAGQTIDEHPVHQISRMFSEKDKDLFILGENLELVKEMHLLGFSFNGFVDSQEDWFDECFDETEVDYETGDMMVKSDCYKKYHNKAVNGLHFIKFMGWRIDSTYSQLEVDCDDNGKASYSWGPFESRAA